MSPTVAAAPRERDTTAHPTPNFPRTLVGISDHIYRQTDGHTFETQHFPNSLNQPNFPSTELKPGQQFNSTTIFQFSREGRTLTP